jgi:hypothetical protein
VFVVCRTEGALVSATLNHRSLSEAEMSGLGWRGDFIRKKKQKSLKCIDIFLKKMYIYTMRFTKHALERMRERGISEKQVLTALANSVSFSSSKYSEDVYVTAGEADGRLLKIVFNPAIQVVLTVYWADKKKGAGYGKK